MIKNEFYYLRHGETEANANVQMAGGDWDLPLNETGERQALEAAEKIQKLLPTIDHFFVSTMLRARQTVGPLLERYPHAKTSYLDEIIEWRVGEWEKRPFAEIQHHFFDEVQPPGGESCKEFKQRILAGVTQVHDHEGTKLVVAHGGVWWFLLQQLDVPTFFIENSTPYRLYESSGKWNVERL